MAEEKKQEKDKTKFKSLVVKELPKIDVTTHFDEENNIEYEIVTIEQAMTEMLETVREISKRV